MPKVSKTKVIYRSQPYVSWDGRFEELNRYKEKYGNCNVSRYDEENKQLANWVQNQRAAYKKNKLLPERIGSLQGIGFEWTLQNKVKHVGWDVRFEQLEGYRKDHGDCDVPCRYKSNPSLGHWVSLQRQLYKKGKLSEERTDLLDEIGFEWECHKIVGWDARFDQLVEYKEVNGNCNVPDKYPANPQLANWVKNQRSDYKKGKLAKERIESLQGIGFEWVIGRGCGRRQAVLVEVSDVEDSASGGEGEAGGGTSMIPMPPLPPVAEDTDDTAVTYTLGNETVQAMIGVRNNGEDVSLLDEHRGEEDIVDGGIMSQINGDDITAASQNRLDFRNNNADEDQDNDGNSFYMEDDDDNTSHLNLADQDMDSDNKSTEEVGIEQGSNKKRSTSTDNSPPGISNKRQRCLPTPPLLNQQSEQYTGRQSTLSTTVNQNTHSIDEMTHETAHSQDIRRDENEDTPSYNEEYHDTVSFEEADGGKTNTNDVLNEDVSTQNDESNERVVSNDDTDLGNESYMIHRISKTPILSSLILALAIIIVFSVVSYSSSSDSRYMIKNNNKNESLDLGEATMLHDVSDDHIIETHLDTNEKTSTEMNQVNLERIETLHESNSATSIVPQEYTQAHRFDNSMYDTGVRFIEENQTLVSATAAAEEEQPSSRIKLDSVATISLSNEEVATDSKWMNQSSDKFGNEGINVSDNQESGSFIEPQTEDVNTYAYDSSVSVVTIQVDTKAEIDMDLGNEEVLVARDTNVKVNDDESNPLAEPRIKAEESDTDYNTEGVYQVQDINTPRYE